jgi:hypothetical protein
MSDKVRIWNRDTEPYVEVYKDKTYTIEPGKFIIMEYFKAVDFIGQWPGKGIKKMLEKEAIPGDEEPVPFVCNMCRGVFSDQKSLDAHSKTHRPAEEEAKTTAELVEQTVKSEGKNDTITSTGNRPKSGR